MTKKDYIKLAELVSTHTIYDDDRELDILYKDTIVDSLCDILEDDNPRFDRERFIAACK